MILGDGMLARAFAAGPGFAREDVVIFAKGVSNSVTEDEREFLREVNALEEAIKAANAAGALFVYFSSGGAVYGEQRSSRTETCALKPITRYGCHKQQCERLIESKSRNYLIMRLPNVVGHGGSAAQLVPSLMRQVAAGHVTVQRYATRDLIGSVELVWLASRLIAKGVNREIFNVASGISTSISDIVGWISDELELEPNVILEDEGVPQIFSIAKLKAALGELPVFGTPYPERIVRLCCNQ